MGRVLLACEESQAVMKAFRERGHEAFSCDLQNCSGGEPQWHYQQDAGELLREKHWDLVIAFPPCTYLTTSGNRWFNVEKYGEKAIQRDKDREAAINFFMMFANADVERVAIENPVGVMSSRFRKPDQCFHPYHFGDPAEKRTCLWLKNLPRLVPTNVVEPPERRKFKSGKTMAHWMADAWDLPPAERSKVRSKTFQGVANAMAEQWGALIE